MLGYHYEKLDLSEHESYPAHLAEVMMGAVDNASNHDKATLVQRGGKSVAAVVPVEVLQFYGRATNPAFMISRSGGHPVRVAESIVVARSTDKDHSGRMWIDGQLFEYATIDGYHVHVSRQSATPGVSLTIAAAQVKVEDRP